ncbi:protein-disulfide reductase DsbD [Variovorax ginsengisoli]|uniref:Thiol:disulfide interchange protein DsbD n=1 Tax=Variovorax ginsengisoli TaxID=363844 RepID=A0ABT9S7V3_9BURK|nr:protein-disulfide reductase DsbD [Variovorax ginsengisoli]MDP9899452.1 thiol:disulfide interchange protein DsbD [Variovorax ginsengisoli]
MAHAFFLWTSIVPALPSHGIRAAWPALLLLASLLAGPAHAADDFLAPEAAFALSVEPSTRAASSLNLHWKIAPGYYLYRDRIGVTATPADRATTVDKPAGERKEDPNFGVMAVYHDAVTVGVSAPGAQALTVTWQGCAEAGLCYPPLTRTIAVAGSAPTPEAPTSIAEAASASDSRITQLLGERTLVWTVPLFFLLGIALAFTPCVLPMLPIVSGIVVGQQAPPRLAFALSLAFVLPMALTYALLGAGAALAGANLQALLQNRWTLAAFAAVFVVLAAAMFDFFTLQLPAFVRHRLDGASQRRRGGTVPGAAALGVLSALLVGPCMTAPLAGTLLYIAQTGHVASGALLLFALGLGMGLPLILIVTVGARYLPKPGPWMGRLKGAMGFVLLGTAIWMVQRVMPAPWALGLWGAWLAGFAVTLAHLATAAGVGGRLLARSAAGVCGIWACALLLGAAAGGEDPLRPLAFEDPLRPLAFVLRANAAPGLAAGESASASTTLPFETIVSPQALQTRLAAARSAGQPVLVDFSADWCISCKTIEREVFTDPQVRQALAGVVLLRADVTHGDAGQQALMRDHQVLGPPTVMLFDARGQERRDARLVGEFGVADLLQRQPGAASPMALGDRS